MSIEKIKQILKGKKKIFAVSLLSMFVFNLTLTSYGISLVYGQSAQKIELTLWYTQDPSSDEGLLLKTMVSEYEQKNPTITVKLVQQNFFTAHDTYKNAFLSNTQPDIYRSSEGDVTEWIFLGAIKELSEFMNESDKDDFIEFSKYTAVFKQGEKEFWYAIPEVMDLLFMFYNKKIFQDAGIPEPTGNWSWSEFRETCKQITKFMRDNSLGSYGFNIYKELQYSFNVFLWGFGGDYWAMDEQGEYKLNKGNVTINSSAAIEALNFMLDLKNNQSYDNRVMPEQNAGSETGFKEGQHAIVINGPWAINSILKGRAFQNVYNQLGIALIPGRNSSDPTPRTPVGGHTYVIAHNCPHVKEAYNLINYLTNSDANIRRMLELGLMPVRKSAYNSSQIQNDPKAKYFMDLFIKYLPLARVGHPKLVNWKHFAADQLGNQLKRIWTDPTLTPTEILSTVQTLWENNLYLTLSGGEEIRPVSYWYLIISVIMAIALIPMLHLMIRKLKFKKSWKETVDQYKKEMKTNKLAYIMIIGTLTVLILEVFLPLLITLDTSFRNYTPAAESINPLSYKYPDLIGFQNYVNIFTNELFFQILFNTIFWTVACVSLQVILGLGISILLNKQFKGRTLYRTLLILPWAVPSYVTVYIWRVFILQDSSLGSGEPGLLNILAQNLFGTQFRFLSANVAFSLPGLSTSGIAMFPVTNLMLSAILVNVWLGIPFVVVSFTAGLSNIPTDLYEAADIEGASTWYKFRKITLPLLKPTFMTVTLLGTIWTFNMFNVLFILALNTNIPLDSYSILAVWVYELAFHNFTKGAAAAVSWVIFGMLLLFAVFYKKTLNSEKMYS